MFIVSASVIPSCCAIVVISSLSGSGAGVLSFCSADSSFSTSLLSWMSSWTVGVCFGVLPSMARMMSFAFCCASDSLAARFIDL